MSFFLKIIFIFSFINISTSLRQTRYSNSFFYNKDAAIAEAQLYLYLDTYGIYFPEYIKELLDKIISYALDFLKETEIIPYSLIFDFDLMICLSKIYDAYKYYNSTGTLVFLESTGKSMNDFGNEHYCLRNEITFNDSHKILPNYYIFQAKLENASRMTNQEDFNLVEFLFQPCFFLGVCLPYNCSNIFHKILNNSDFRNYMYDKLLLSNLTLKASQDTNNEYKEKNYEINGNIILYLFYAIFGIKILVSFIRFICYNKGYERLIPEQDKNKLNSNEYNKDIDKEKIENDYLIDEKNKESEEIEEKEEKFKSSKSSSSKDFELENDYIKYIYGISTKEEGDLYNPFHDSEKDLPIKWKIMKALDLFDNIKLFISVSNRYYNSCGIKRIYFIKIVVMLFSITLQLMINQTQLPPKSFLATNLYTSFLFFSVKICVFSTVFWIVLDAMDAGYKLMSFLKKKIRTINTKELGFLSFAQFLVLLIPKIVLFLLCYIFLHILERYFMYFLSSENHRGPFIIFDRTIDNDNYSLRTSRNGNLWQNLINLIPIWINYLDYFIEDDPNNEKKIINYTIEMINSNKSHYDFYENDLTNYKVPSPFLTNTDLFINIYLNEFVLIIFMLLVAYLSYKMRNKIFDFIILILNLILYIIPAINLTKYTIEAEEKYTLLHVLGQNFSEKYTHYFINFYYFGFMLGVMLFYNNENIYKKMNSKFEESINNNSMGLSHNSTYETFTKENNMPFPLFKFIILKLNNISFLAKRSILLCSLAFIILISFSFNIFQKYCEDDDYGKDINENINENFRLKLPKINDYISIKFIFLYEKNLCCIFFFIFLLMLIVYPHDKSIINFLNLNCFVFFDRISFSMFCTHNFFVIASFVVFYLDFKIILTNIILTSFGLFILLIIFNALIVCSFELPVRIIIKSCMNKNITTKFKSSFIFDSSINQTRRTTTNDYKSGINSIGGL